MLVTSLLGFFFLMFGIDIDSGDEVPEVEAIVGSTVLLNCSFPVKASMSISLQVLDWLFNKTTVVHRHEKGADVHVHQDGRFRGRTEVFVKELPSGNFSLLLRNVDLDDAGLYTCQAYMSTGYWTEHSLLQILRGPEAKSPKTTNMITSQTTDLTVNERVFLVLALLLILTVFIAIMMYFRKQLQEMFNKLRERLTRG
ncbi:V-set domain-containing T-cell activation inhibitor 1-like isoform X1 [Polypterus senegalus]|uniref:V-set domain-containing T-cell activation inhibitor 1-like isoform X1 n=1 Tax=Polypterus senegalus TaxID=55291 RepID=UPI001965159B|nr:V-set domain-containing T-cell activation inhibitor 1-like isoform X1 [Polypterus senegalus]XP_039591832.1 V-set domain-containing T-cell activation inhibitor 1-like isoform X1 [Polypterus senegalus]